MSSTRVSKWADLIPTLSYVAVLVAFAAIVLAGLLPGSDEPVDPVLAEAGVVAPSSAGAQEASSAPMAIAEAPVGLGDAEGAPPVIPHEIDDVTIAPACLDCHGVVAPAARHELRPVCTQCHATGPPGRSDGASMAENGVEGEPTPGEGGVVFAGAPPLIPHPTMMRASCLSCHGDLGLAGPRTPHPDRATCTGCHSPSARGEQN